NDSLDFTKIEAGKLELEPFPISLPDVVEGVAETLMPNVAKKALGLKVFIDPAIPSWLLADQVRIRQVLFNLLGNAVKFTTTTEDRKGVVTLIAERQPGGSDGMIPVRFRISDTGIGMTEKALQSLFTPFTQAERSTTRRFGGTGLGLSICKNLTDLMGGKITVESTYGQGSTFIVDLLVPVAEKAAAHPDETDLDGVNVLLAIPDPDLRRFARAYAENRSATVGVADDLDSLPERLVNGKEAGAPIDVVVFGSDWPREQVDLALRRLRLNADLEGLRFVLMVKDRKEALGISQHDLVAVESNPLRRSGFVRALGIASGRESPELDYSEESLTADAPDAPTEDDAAARGQLILVAEDNPTNRDVIKRQLNKLGYAVEMAEDGRLGLEAWKSGRYALILADCHMPNMDGYEMTEAIRAEEHQRGAGERTPIIAVTANALQGESEKCLATGMDDYLSKPLEMEKLKAALRKWMPGAPPSKGVAAVAPQAAPPAPSGLRIIDPAIVDTTYLRETFGDDEELIHSILGEFVAPTREIAQELLAAYDAGDVKLVGALGHKLKSSSRSVGAHALADLCEKLEHAGGAGDWEDVQRLYADLPGAVTRVLDHLEGKDGGSSPAGGGAGAPDETIIDTSYLRETFGDDEAMIVEILKDFIVPTQEIADEIRVAFEAGDVKGCGAIGHKLKSSSRSIGAHALADLCEKIEHAGVNGNWEDVQRLYAVLPVEVDRVITHIRDL
ncbi:MAG: response regulator, partial [Alphaproteobacteria bacterium]|nr:response regulator [Alphaproteobacteria bacterium]